MPARNVVFDTVLEVKSTLNLTKVCLKSMWYKELSTDFIKYVIDKLLEV